MSTTENQSSGSNGGNEDENCSATLLDLEAFNCPICRNPLTGHIFQCDAGHIIFSECRNKVRNQCPSCRLPLGHIRCRGMERIMKAIMVPCSNSKFGCTKTFSFGNEDHEKYCSFALCSCPALNCNFKGVYKDVYSHFSVHRTRGLYCQQIKFGQSTCVYIEFTPSVSYVLSEEKEGILFVLQCYQDQIGAYVYLSVIAPFSVDFGEISCSFSTLSTDPTKLTLELPRVKRVKEVISFQAIEDDFMLIPSYLLQGGSTMKLSVCVKKLYPRS